MRRFSRYTMTCPHCRVGLLDLRAANVLYWHEQNLICSPNTPAWVCDKCRYREADPVAVQRLSILAQQSAMPQPTSRRDQLSRLVLGLLKPGSKM